MPHGQRQSFARRAGRRRRRVERAERQLEGAHRQDAGAVAGGPEQPETAADGLRHRHGQRSSQVQPAEGESRRLGVQQYCALKPRIFIGRYRAHFFGRKIHVSIFER